MAECLLCPDCDEIAMVDNSIFHEKKGVTIYTAYCEFCEVRLYHVDGDGAESIKLDGMVKAESADDELY
ncbi:hypothetical protein H4F04_11090 [Vibrio scophthalmi]|uniref:hypothetical protein n=1 Tax=Vibrio scophthalmi TaxID=45658 RepID=UPI002FF4086C